MLAIEFVLTGLNSSFYPKVLGIVASQQHKGTTVETNKYYHGLTAVSMVLVSVCIFIFPIIIEFVFKKPGYQNAIPLLPFAAIIYLFRPLRLFISFPYSAIKYSKPLPLFYLLVVVVKIGAMYFLVTRFDVFGAIISTWISYGVEILILYFGIRSKFDFKFNLFKMIIGPLSLTVLILLVEPFFGKEYSYWVHGFYVMVAMSMLGWAYRTEIRKILPI
jgi:O-antigen/teichoic acid export membrane protein